MSSKQVEPSAGRALTPGAIALMLMLCLSWGFNQIAVKLALPDVPPMLQALIRSVGALPVMLVDRLAARGEILRARRLAVARRVRGRDVRHRVRADLSRPAAYVGVARGGVSLYRAVLRRARLLSVFLGERLRAPQWGGLALSFAGRRAGDRRAAANVDAKVLLGDLLIVAGGALWAATTLIAKGTALINARAGKGARLSGRAIDPDSRLRSRGCSAKPSPTCPSRCRSRCWPIRRSGWWADVPVVVRAGERPTQPANCQPSPSSRRCSASSPATSSCTIR